MTQVFTFQIKAYATTILTLDNKDFVKSLVTVTRLIQITVEFRFDYSVLILIIIGTFHHASIMASIPSERFYNNNFFAVMLA